MNQVAIHILECSKIVVNDGEICGFVNLSYSLAFMCILKYENLNICQNKGGGAQLLGPLQKAIGMYRVALNLSWSETNLLLQII